MCHGARRLRRNRSKPILPGVWLNLYIIRPIMSRTRLFQTLTSHTSDAQLTVALASSMHSALVCLCACLEGTADLDTADDGLRKPNSNKRGRRGTGYDYSNTKGKRIWDMIQHKTATDTGREAISIVRMFCPVAAGSSA